MRNVINNILPHALAGILIFSIITPGLGYPSQVYQSSDGDPYPPASDVTSTPYQREGLTLTQLYLPLILKNFPPLPTTSWYMETVNTEMLLDLGCSLGYRDHDLSDHQSIVILDFNFPTYTNGEYGARLFTNGPVSTNAIAAAVEFFGIGYATCVYPNSTSNLTIAVGTNNCNQTICPGSVDSALYYEHGAAWAEMINEIGTYFVNYDYFPQVRAYGASDMEVDWNDPYTTKQWVDGYNSVNNWPMFNFGDAQGCPQIRTYQNSYCDNGWYQFTIWYISGRGGLNSSLPLPLIYDNDGANGKQWYGLSAYGFDMQNGRLNIQGSVTESLACSQRGCNPDLDNTPQEGYTDLYKALNSDPDTSQSLKWSTDIGYSGW